MEVNQIRSLFLDFFKNEGHEIVKSSPLVPHNDPTLMFTNAGMVQFKNYFTGSEKPPYSTATTSQKCVRAGGKHNDLENVGYTARHHTFFEMLGNFSFGDYFKERAIELAWNCLTKEFGINKDKLYITVYHTDEEAEKIWKKITGFSSDRILKITTNDNFWAMGETGPCGPCSEIFYDHGSSIEGGLPGTVNGDGDRYIEIWNLVFMQYEDQLGGKRIQLPKPSIDTGMGLERIASVLQGKHNNYDIDLFQNIIDSSKHLTGNTKDIVSHRVIADHLRSCSFLIADGVMPSNEGRGYVLRRILRRAVRHVHHLGAKEPLLHRLVPALITEMGEAFPELRMAEAAIRSTLLLEEERFMQTIDNGMKLLTTSTASLKDGDVFDGSVAFKLYDTYGFPLDLTQDILKNRGVSVDLPKFENAMKDQKERARAAWAGSGSKATDKIWFDVHEEVGATEFLGYTSDEAEAVVKAIIKGEESVASAKDSEVILVLNQTPFYAESGGQIGDVGMISGNVVTDTKKFQGGVFGHFTKVKVEVKVGDVVHAKIDSARRTKIKANHSATHLLHKALRDTLGAQVTQKGSLVAADRLRFDFANPKAMTSEEIKEVEKKVNEMIISNVNANTNLKTPEEAIADGAMALFGEKYGNEVRVVAMGVSMELCGGTHVRSTGDIGAFKIVSEEAIASGVRRIEAVTGVAAIEHANKYEDIVKTIGSSMKCSEVDILERVNLLQEEKRKLEKEVSSLQIKFALKDDTAPEKIGKVDFLIKKLNDIPAQELKNIADILMQKITSGVVAITTIAEGKVSLLVYVSKDLITNINAGELIKYAAPEIDGKGGGKPDMAQAGGTKVSGIDNAIEKIRDMISQKV